MKAITFLEWCDNIMILDDCDNTEGLKFIQKLQRVYSQPFKPEMITELFENAKSLVCYNCRGTGELRKPLIKCPLCLGKGYYVGAGLECKTLDQFISDCQRAGIELTWKPEIEQKYFK